MYIAIEFQQSDLICMHALRRIHDYSETVGLLRHALCNIVLSCVQSFDPLLMKDQVVGE